MEDYDFSQTGERKDYPGRRIKIQHIVANFFIEIANFFRLILCGDPFELYTVENCRRVTELIEKSTLYVEVFLSS